MKAVILAAGRGKRMGELTTDLPKPMLEVRGRPVLQQIIEGMREVAGIQDFFLVIGWRGEVIADYFGDGSKWGVRITYGTQIEQNGTGKAPELARAWIGEDRFLLTYGDILLDAPPTDYADLVAAFREDGVLAVKTGEDLSKGGAVLLDRDSVMVDLIEKGSAPLENAYYNAGIYLLTPAIFTYTAQLEKSPRGEYEFTDALKAAQRAGLRFRGVILRRPWADVRDPGVLAQLNSAATR